RRGHEVIVATRPSEAWASRLRRAGIAHYALPMSSEVDLPSASALARIFRRHRIQIVHAQKGKARTLAMLAGLLVKIPVLVLSRGVSFPLDRFNRLGYTTRRVTAIIAVCESIKGGLVASGVLADCGCCVDSSYDGRRLTGAGREALAVETPVIASVLEGNPELVIDGETGLLFPPRDVTALAAAMGRMMDDPVLAETTTRAGRK